MRKFVSLYLLLTFLIMAVCWGTCLVCSSFCVSLSEVPLLYVPYILGGLSPTIASYVANKLCHGSTFKSWLRETFDFRHRLFSYILLVILAAIFFLLLCLSCGYDPGAPLFAVVFMLPMMLLGGGLEEAGWRGILQLELERKIGFTLSTLITAVIWSFWHLPLFFIVGVSQYGTNFIVFSLNILGLSFALATIKKCTGSTWLCVLFHCLVNSLHGVYLIHDNYMGSIITAAVMILLSYILLWIQRKKHFLS
jgi:membrane protease YdiL (CAAX protease family)